MSHVKKHDFLEYWTDATERVHILNVFCKCCGDKIQEGNIVKNHTGMKIPVLSPLPNYADMYIAFEDENGILRRKSTPMCIDCAGKDFTPEELTEINEADTAVMKERHKHSGVKDERIDRELAGRGKMIMRVKIGYCCPGYAITGEGR